ncbi:MAG: alpha/beta hydrolase [Flavobacteriales bacterium]
MTRTLALALPLFVSCSVGSCQQDAAPPLSLSTHVYRVVGMDTLRLDLRQPAHPRRDCAGLLFVHGGGFQQGARDTPTASQFLDSLAQAGIPSASISYRLTMAGRGFGCDIPTEDKRSAVASAGADARAALDWLESSPLLASHSTGWVIAGSSAGAETALWSGYVDAPDRWKGVVSYSGAIDAATRPSPASPPLFALHGTCDALVPIGSALHHFCPEDRVGAWPLIGGPAWADSLRTTGLTTWTWTQCGGGHGVCNSAMLNPDVQCLLVDWLAGGHAQDRDVCVDQDGAPLPGGRASCPHPCN